MVGLHTHLIYIYIYANGASASVGILYLPPQPTTMLVFCLAWVVSGLKHTVSCLTALLYPENTLKKKQLIYYLWPLQSFYITSSKILKLKMRCVKYMFPLKLRTPNSLIYFPLISWVPVLNATYFKKKFLWKVLKDTVSNKKVIRSHFNTLSIKQNNSIEFFSRTCLATGSWLIIRPLSQL